MTTPLRPIEYLVISDTHLGTYGAQARKLLRYLQSVQPKTLIINGDFVDAWQFKKSFFPESHMKVVKHIMNWVADGVRVYYLTGNHDEMLRKFKGFEFGSFSLRNQLVLEIDGKKTWIFHGDVFDVSMKGSTRLARIGTSGYELLIRFNKIVNLGLKKIGKPKVSISKLVKDKVKGAIKKVNKFEETIVSIAGKRGYRYVICGHIHKPEIKSYGEVTYLNSGDWIENLSSLEYNEGKWSLYYYNDTELNHNMDSDLDISLPMTHEETFSALEREFGLSN